MNCNGETISSICDVRGMLLLGADHLGSADTERRKVVTVKGTVEAVDHKARTVTIRSQGGNVVTVDVPPNATRFEQVKVGDTVKATYYDRISLRLKPAGEPAVDRTIEPTTTATPGLCQVRREPGSASARP